jgi:hypothetical protein
MRLQQFNHLLKYSPAEHIAAKDMHLEPKSYKNDLRGILNWVNCIVFIFF